MKFETTDNPQPSDLDAVLAGLNDHNDAAVPRDFRDLAVFARLGQKIVAGAVGASV